MVGDKKVRVQIQHVLYSLKEAFEEFKLKLTDVKITLSNFCHLRPTFVRCASSIPHNVYVSMLHEKMRCALESLSRSSGVFSIIKTVKFYFKLYL